MLRMAIILGLESSCDDSAAALVTADRQILAQAIVGQNEAHRPFGGVVPEIAAHDLRWTAEAALVGQILARQRT